MNRHELGEPDDGPDTALLDALRAHIDSDPSATFHSGELARGVGVDQRTVHEQLRSTLRVSPHEFVRQHRFDRVHRDLLAACSGSLSVADCARYWGFVHFGRFSAAYVERHGEQPGDTLARPAPPAGTPH